MPDICDVGVQCDLQNNTPVFVDVGVQCQFNPLESTPQRAVYDSELSDVPEELNTSAVTYCPSQESSSS